ncbi:MAG: peptidoglycan DD-metalloendopeptidase family protein, partial [Bacteroidota bacterium]
MKKRTISCFIFIAAIAIMFPYVLGQAALSPTQNAIKDKKEFPQGYFIVPTDSSLKIAGNFGEIRPNHFHAGLDIKTGGREGTYIFAAADGYISRIKISPYGYGKCLYITHPNGYVTVYAHLQRLYGKVAAYLKQEQYKAESYDVDIYP